MFTLQFTFFQHPHSFRVFRLMCGCFFSLRIGVLLLLSFGSLSCSTTPPDTSSKSANDSGRKSDSLRVALLLEEAWKWQSVNPDSCKYYANEAAEMARQFKMPAFESEAECRFGNLDESDGRFAKAIEHYQRSIQLDSISGNKNGQARANLYIGSVLRKTGRYDSALIYTQRAIVLYEALPGMEMQLGTALISSGNVYLRIGQLDKALLQYQKSLTLATASGSKQLEASSCNSIGLVYEQQKMYDRAMDMYQRSLNIEEERKNNRGIAIACNNIGNVWYYRDEYRTALIWYQRSIELKNEINYTQGTAGTLSNIGLIYEALGDYNQALTYHKKSYVIQSESGEQQETAISANNTGVVLRRLGSTAEAIHFFEQALAISEKTNGPLVKIDVLQNLSEVYADQGNFSRAFVYTRRAQQVRDSLDRGMRQATETDRLYQEEKSRLKLLQKEKEKQQLELRRKAAEARQQQIVLYALITGVFLLSLLFLTLWRANRQKQRAVIAEQQQKIKEQATDELLRNQELIVLRSMLDAQERERQRIAKDLHDRLGLKLSTARLYYSMVGQHLNNMDEEEQVQYGNGNKILDEACDELRKVAHNLVSGELMRFGLTQALERLCETLQEVTALEIGFYASGLDDRLDSQSELQLYQIIQELLTNVHRHAHAKKVTVQFSRYNHTLNVMVEDDGIGFQPQLAYTGIGLNNVRERVNRLNGTIQIDSQLGRGTTISIDIAVL